MTQWCRYLPDFGWRPTVLCRHYGFTATPELLAREVHPDVTVRYLNTPTVTSDAVTSGRQSLKRRVRRYGASAAGMIAVPDQSVLFWRGIRQRVLELAEQIEPDVVLTTSPPHSTHDAGLWLAPRLGIPWVADFRDPFTIDKRFQRSGAGAVSWPATKQFEARIYERAQLILHAIPLHARWARLKYAGARDRIRWLPNGVPQELTDGIERRKEARSGRKSIRIVGLLDDSVVLLLARAVAQLAQGGQDVELCLAGKPPRNMKQIQSILGERLVSMGLVQHRVALELVAGADVLICALDRSRSQILGLSSKLFEYLAVGRPVISINPTVPDRQLLSGFRGVQCLFDPELPEVISSICDALAMPHEHLEGQAREFAVQFSRRAQVQQLSNWLEEIA